MNIINIHTNKTPYLVVQRSENETKRTATTPKIGLTMLFQGNSLDIKYLTNLNADMPHGDHASIGTHNTQCTASSAGSVDQRLTPPSHSSPPDQSAKLAEREATSNRKKKFIEIFVRCYYHLGWVKGIL